MKRINPIYILGLIIVLFIGSYTSLNNKKEEFRNSTKEINTLSKKAKNYKDYKDTWFNEKTIIKRVDSIIKNPSFRKEKILKSQTENKIRIKMESQNPRILNRFLNRMLNEKFIFKKLDIQKSSITLEIGLK